LGIHAGNHPACPFIKGIANSPKNPADFRDRMAMPAAER
jgi:hypothetical protein